MRRHAAHAVQAVMPVLHGCMAFSHGCCMHVDIGSSLWIDRAGCMHMGHAGIRLANPVWLQNALVAEAHTSSTHPQSTWVDLAIANKLTDGPCARKAYHR